MKALLTTLNARYTHSSLALKCLYAAVDEHSKSIDMKEFTINNDEDSIFTEIMRVRYDIIFFSCYIWNIERILDLAQNIKKANWKTRIVVGGPEVSYDTADFMRTHHFIDMAIAGEGEGPFKQLLDVLEADSKDFSKIKGLTYRADGKIYMNAPSELGDMNDMVFPYLRLPVEEDKILYYESARGCPFQCAYCLSSIDHSMRTLEMDRVKSELDYFLFKGVTQVKFVDRTFNWNGERAYEITKYLIQNDNGKTNFHFELCADLIDDKYLHLIKNARKGLFQFEIGIQSTNHRTLAACNRSMNWEKTTYNIGKIIESGNIHLHLDLIAGLPFEDYASFRNSFNAVYALKANHLQLGFLKMLKGSPIRSQAEAYKYIYREKAPYEVISNIFIVAGDLVRLKMIETLLDLYYNKDGFKDTLSYATAFLAETPFDFYEEFSNFYYLKGYQNRAHKKEDLYRILLRYANWKERHHPGAFSKILELLEWDMSAALNPEVVKKFERKGWEI